MRKRMQHVAAFQERFHCPYFKDGRMAKVEYLFPSAADVENFHAFLARGYRRFSKVFYRNVCEQCSACLPLRLHLSCFQPSRSQRRVLKKNGDVRIVVKRPSELTKEKVRLYGKYVKTKHGAQGEHDAADPEMTLLMMHYGFDHVLEMDYYIGDRLMGVGIVDEGKDSLSANYFYYDTDFLERSAGTYSMLQEIFLAQNMGKAYHYLGFFIEENPKMSYKKFFRPNQIFENGTWKVFL
jgi:arginine-tRNA-protein transferase